MNSFEKRPGLIGYEEALQLALTNVCALPDEFCPTSEALGRVASRQIRAIADLPSADSALKDGYAVRSSDIEMATYAQPVMLKLKGTSCAGEESKEEVVSGTAMRILSGAIIPKGSNAVVAEEFTESDSNIVKVFADAHFGRNILRTGTDIRSGEALVDSGEIITPAKVGLLVAGGVFKVNVTQLPKVGLLATGDEVLLPGRPLTNGKLYASNIALQEAWLHSIGIKCAMEVSGDSFDQLTRLIDTMISEQDLLITSGGAWTGDRDLVVKALNYLAWEPIFHRVRMGPGKAVGMGLLRGKPVFCLPGGPPSNEMAFLMITLPAISRMLRSKRDFLPKLYGLLTEDLTGQTDWTQFIHCDLTRINGAYHLKPLDMTSRLSAMSRARAIVKIPEGTERLVCKTNTPFYAVDLYSE